MATFVVAHGAWSSAWAWKKMRPLLRAAGHELWTPSYTGLGERAHLASPANPPSKRAVDYFVKVVRDYKVDGVVAVIMRSCGLVPGMQRQLKEGIYRETGVPTLMFDLDGGDQREYDDAAVKSHLDAFVETLLARKGG